MERARLSLRADRGPDSFGKSFLRPAILSVFSQRAANSILGLGLIVLIECRPCKGGAVVPLEIGFAGSVSFGFD